MTDDASGAAAGRGALLDVSALESGYGPVGVLKALDLAVGHGEIVTVLGRNGMGKSTLVKTVMGIVRPSRGAIRLDGTDVAGWPSHRIARSGIGYVPEGREIFPNLTVHENLQANHRTAPGRDRWTLDTVFALFPRLRERLPNLGTKLSGGEQQMLAIGRALMTNPKLLILDEATEGLAPLVRREIWDCLRTLKETGLAMIVIDKNLKALKQIADRHVVMSKGAVIWRGTSTELDHAPDVVREHIGI